jgi:hypothetical protein
MIRSTIAATTIVLSLATCSFAQVDLRWKIADNETLTTTARTKVEQTLSIAGQDLETKTETTLVVSTVSGKRSPDGTIGRTSKIESLKSDLSLPGGVVIEFDSSKPVEPQGTQYDVLLDLMQVVAKTNSTSVCGDDNRVISIDVDRSSHENLDDTVKQLIKGPFDSDYLKEASNNDLDQIPSKPIKEGDTWTLTKTVRLEAGQSLTFTTRYEYAGTVDRDGKALHKITYTSTEVSYGQENPSGPAKVTDSDLKIESSDGTILFDSNLGRIVEQKEKVHIKGDMTFDINGQELPGKLDLAFDNKTTIQ